MTRPLKPASVPGRSGSGGYEGIFQDMTREAVFDMVTAMYLDVSDDDYIAEHLSKQFQARLSANQVRGIRADAAREAETTEDPQARRKWIFRYQRLTVNNLVKEHMFLSGTSRFFEAKIELADELFWLKQKVPTKKLWIAINQAVGRNNVSLDIVNELLSFRDTVLRIKKIVKRKAKKDGTNAEELLVQVSEQISEAYNGEFNKDGVRTAHFAAEILGCGQEEITLDDVDFFNEHARCIRFPERSAMMRLVEGADTLEEDDLIRQAKDGNIANFSGEEVHGLIKQMRASPILKKEALEDMLDYINRRLRRKNKGDEILESLRNLVKIHLSLTEILRFYPGAGMMKFRMVNVTESELQELLDALNPLARSDEVVSYLKNVIKRSKHSLMMKSFASDYCKKRFGADFNKLASGDRGK